MAYQAITEQNIGRLVERFYDKIRTDNLLGPIFVNKITNWEQHLARMTRFWSSVMLADGGYKGDPLATHQNVPGIEPMLFEHWLGLWRGNVNEMFEPDLARAFEERATRIADSLKLGLFYEPSENMSSD